MSNLRNALCRVTILSGHVAKPHVVCRIKKKGHVALSNLEVNSHRGATIKHGHSVLEIGEGGGAQFPEAKREFVFGVPVVRIMDFIELDCRG